jgi:hypothetical protein
VAGRTLSPRERRILAELEHELRQETALDLALRTMLLPKASLRARFLDRCGRIALDWMVLLTASGLALGTVAVAVRTALVGALAGAFWALFALLALARSAGRRRRRLAFRTASTTRTAGR